MMKRIYMMCLLIWITIRVLQAQILLDGQVKVSNLDIARTEGNLFVAMEVNVSGLELKMDREMVLTPVLRNGTDSLRLPAIIVAGRNRYFYHQRNDSLADNVLIRRTKKDTVVDYRAAVPYKDWMATAVLMMDEGECGCRCEVLMSDGEKLTTLDFKPKVFKPVFVYLAPQAEAEKIREMRGSAFIDFPVNRTYIRENYRNNYAELQKIRNTIDVVRNDSDTYITSVFIKGYASPEASWATNTRLAKGRTEALKEYVRKLYEFPDTLMSTAYQPEDWDGLRRYVDTSALANKAGILAIINNDMNPDSKEYELKKRYPADYDFLYKNVYPGLRHSDYVVQYHVRTYSDVAESRRIMLTEPQKLSLRELFLVAQDCVPGSDEYNEVFAIAVRMFPNDATANLNAANTAMGLGDLKNALRYLDKAGDSAEAVYARAIYAALNVDYEG
ncbi:MAG: DUF3868 domain-containing protein, partial [Odoribacter sp.]|nr:DUF3868 domain-containing protein [Odoribacter sp.]